MKARVRWADPSGNMSLVAVASCFGLVGLLVVLLAFYQVWLRHMHGQLVADAATQAAVEALRPGIGAELQRQGEANLSAFWAEVNRAVAGRLEAWEAHYRELYEPNPADYPDDETYQEALRQFEAGLRERRRVKRRQYREDEVRDRKPEIAELLLSGEPLPLPALVRYFLSPEERGCAVLAAARQHRRDMEEAAAELAAANGAQLAEEPTTETEGTIPGVLGQVSVPVRLGWLQDYLQARHQYVEGQARVFIRSVASEPVVIPEACH